MGSDLCQLKKTFGKNDRQMANYWWERKTDALIDKFQGYLW